MKTNELAKIQKGRNHLIDLLRFLAASCVAIFHFNEPIPYIDNFYRDFCKVGFLGVPVFFIISGYCIRIAENHSISAKEFIIRRLFRILPPYWFSVILIVVFAISMKILIGTNSIPMPKNAQGILATLFLFTTPLTHFKAINWVYWTLPYEVFFYLIITLVMLFKENIKRILLVILLVISIIIPFQSVGVLFFFNELPIFLLGYSLHLILNNKRDLLGVVLLLFSLLGVFIKHPGFEYLALSVGVCLLIFIDKLKPLRNNFFSNLGDYSYSMYLIHVPIGIYVLGFIKNYKLVQTNVMINILCDMSLLVLIVFISRFTFEWIELKSIKIGKKISNKPITKLNN